MHFRGLTSRIILLRDGDEKEKIWEERGGDHGGGGQVSHGGGGQVSHGGGGRSCHFSQLWPNSLDQEEDVEDGLCEDVACHGCLASRRSCLVCSLCRYSHLEWSYICQRGVNKTQNKALDPPPNMSVLVIFHLAPQVDLNYSVLGVGTFISMEGPAELERLTTFSPSHCHNTFKPHTLWPSRELHITDVSLLI